MIRISAGYSKKVPGEEDYSSNGFHLTIDAEVPDILVENPEKLREKISSIFREAKQNVEAQMNGNHGNGNGEVKASDKQKSFIVSLARRRHGLEPDALTQWTNGVQITDLSKKQASDLISRLKGVS
jgi:hypothetical protein